MLMSRGRHVNDSIPDFRVYLVTTASQAQKYRFSCSTSVLLLADGVVAATNNLIIQAGGREVRDRD